MKIARLFIKGNFNRRLDDAGKILKIVSKEDFKAKYFLTPSGFATMPWKFSSFEEAAKAGMRYAEKLLKGIEINANYIFLGIDSYSCHYLTKPHVELSVVCSPEPHHVTGKIYPTLRQQKGLFKSDLDSHFLKLDDRIVILCCHDLSIFNPRSDNIVTGWRKEIKKKFKEKTVKFKPEVCLHNSHFTDTPFTWLVSWRVFEDISGVKHYATAGVYHRKGGERAKLGRTLELTKKGDVLDIIV